MTNSNVYGIWKHEMVDGGSSSVTTQTLRNDGTYETRMIFRFGDGCEQHIHHYGTFEIGEATLELTFGSGETSMKGCADPSKNFERRDFTEAESDEARSLLAQAIPHSIDGDSLTTTVRGPMGEMNIVYERYGE